jgi:hypothetical protein
MSSEAVFQSLQALGCAVARIHHQVAIFQFDEMNIDRTEFEGDGQGNGDQPNGQAQAVTASSA